MPSTTARHGSEKANVWLAGLAFVVAALALFQGRAAAVALVLMICGFALILTRLRQERDEADAQLGLPDEVTRVEQLLEQGAPYPALRVAHRVAELAESATLQRTAVELVAWCELALGRPEGARNALSWLGGSAVVDPFCRAAVEDACGQSLWALHILDRAARRRPLSRPAIRFWIDLSARLRGVEAACSLTAQQLTRLTPADVAKVVAFARSAGTAERFVNPLLQSHDASSHDASSHDASSHDASSHDP